MAKELHDVQPRKSKPIRNSCADSWFSNKFKNEQLVNTKYTKELFAKKEYANQHYC